MSHSPAPWRFTPRTDYPNGHIEGIWDANGDQVVVTDSGYYPPTIDDARLIAAAPDLLQACRMALNDRMYKEWPAIAEALMAAIKKAGEEL